MGEAEVPTWLPRTLLVIPPIGGQLLKLDTSGESQSSRLEVVIRIQDCVKCQESPPCPGELQSHGGRGQVHVFGHRMFAKVPC
jgi:hypothetical protein